MSGYSMIAEVGMGIIQLLRSQMVPEVILNADAIGLCGPDDKGDLSLGLHLYDVKESEEVAGSGDMRMVGETVQRYPSTFLNLFYMITAYSSSDIKFRASEEQRILGKTIQILADNSILNPSFLGENSGMLTFPIKIELLRIDNEEKMKLWNMPNLPYRLSLYYKVYPVEIESMRQRHISRVLDTNFTIQENK